MPPVRTRTDSLNSAPQNVESPYNIPSRNSPVRGITFAPNVAAETYNEPPELIVPPESTLFPSAGGPESPRKTSHSKKKPDDWIPRPPNAFILFRSEMVEQFIKSQHVPGDVEANHGNLSKIIGLCWRNLPFEERDVWECKARIAMAEHKAKYPNYRFRPNQKDPNLVKRRVKEPPAPPDEKRCEEIATLLVEGMKGDELSCAVKALDATRPPEAIQPRFDDPITATLFRRSSSAPVPEAEEEKFVKPSTPSTPTRPSRASKAKKPRAASSSPVKKRAPRLTMDTTPPLPAASLPHSSSPAPSFNSESDDGSAFLYTGTPYAYSPHNTVFDQPGHPLAEPTCSQEEQDPFLNPFEARVQYELPFPQDDVFNSFDGGAADSPMEVSYPTQWSPMQQDFYVEADSASGSPTLAHTPVSELGSGSPYLSAPVPRTDDLGSALTQFEFAAINRGYSYPEYELFTEYVTVFPSPVVAGEDLRSLHDYRDAVQELHIGAKPLHPHGETQEMNEFHMAQPHPSAY